MSTCQPTVVVIEQAVPSVHSSPDLESPVLLPLIARGPAGPQGAPGPSGGNAVQRVAGEVLSALRVVYELDGEVFYLDPADAAHVDQVLGVTLTSALLGQPINVQSAGTLDDATWAFTPGPVWLGAAGSLTQLPPAGGFDVLIGAAVSATRINLNIQEPIDLTE